jgi:hypothetical protein
MRFGIVLLGFIIIAGVLLFTEHGAHVFGALSMPCRWSVS